MAITFRKRFRLLPFLWINLGKMGVSFTLGVKPIFFTFSRRGMSLSASLPKTGIGYRKNFPKKSWNVGGSISAALKQWQKEPTGAEHSSPKPHIRRAHWHGCWKGERKSKERAFFYKWLPPIIVNIDNKA